MAARRLARPAPPPPLPANRCPANKGGINGSGGPSARQGCQRGLPPRQRTPRPCLRAASPLRTRGARGHQKVAGKPEVEMAKSHCKGHKGTAAVFCPRWDTETSDTAVPWLLLPCPSAAGRTSHPCPSVFAAAPRLVSKITRNGKPGLNPTSAAHPSPSVHGASRAIKG